MRYRVARQRSTGQWCQFLVQTDGAFSVPLSAHQQNVAEGFGLPLDDVEVVEGEGPPPNVSAGVAPLPGPPDPMAALTTRLRTWFRDPAKPPVDRQWGEDVLRVLRHLIGGG